MGGCFRPPFNRQTGKAILFGRVRKVQFFVELAVVNNQKADRDNGQKRKKTKKRKKRIFLRRTGGGGKKIFGNKKPKREERGIQQRPETGLHENDRIHNQEI